MKVKRSLADRAWRDLGLAWDEALCGLDMALLLDPAQEEVRAAAEAGVNRWRRRTLAAAFSERDRESGTGAKVRQGQLVEVSR